MRHQPITSARPAGTVLLTLGRLPVALDIARAFYGAGWRVLVAEPLRWHPCRVSKVVEACFVTAAPESHSPRYQQDLLDIIQRESVDLVLPISEEILHVSLIRGRLPAGVHLLSMPHDRLIRLHDKWQFSQWAHERGVAVPETCLGGSRAAEELAKRTTVVVKPRLSCSGRGVYPVSNGLLDSAANTHQHVIQAQMLPECLSSMAIATKGECLVLVTYRSLLESGKVSVCFESVSTPREIQQFNHDIIDALAFSGMISFDFMKNHQGNWCTIECNPRATSALHFMSPSCMVQCLLHAAGLNDQITADTTIVSQQRQEIWSSLTELEGRLLKGSFEKALWKRFLTTRDISWQRRDWKPCVLMPVVLWPVLQRAMVKRRPISQVIMRDMGWYTAEVATVTDLPDRRIAIDSTPPKGLVELLASVSFGSEGLRYQRLSAAEQVRRFVQPTFFTARCGADLIGAYIIDTRRLLVDGHETTGYYRGALVVKPGWQGKGVGDQLTRAALAWIDQQGRCSQRPVLSYGCIDKTNTRSLALLAKQKALPAGDINLFMMYRQWPKKSCDIAPMQKCESEGISLLWRQNHADCSWLDITPPTAPYRVCRDKQGVRVAAVINTTTFRLVNQPRWLRLIIATTVAPWPMARKRFNPDNFRMVVFSQVVVRPGCEKDWQHYVSSVLAEYGVHFGVVYVDPHSAFYQRVLRTSWLGKLVHSHDGGIALVARWHASNTVSANVRDEALDAEVTLARHALFPADA